MLASCVLLGVQLLVLWVATGASPAKRSIVSHKDFVFHRTTKVASVPASIYLKSEILDVVQMHHLYDDQKMFVDHATSKPLNEVITAFSSIDKTSPAAVKAFVSQNFREINADLKVWFSAEWKEKPSFLAKIKNEKLRKFGKDVHGKWQGLFREYNPKPEKEGCVHSSLPTSHPFVVPGGRFREFFYWDTFWIMKGLVVSEMCGSVNNMLENFRSFIEKYGYIPNGSRVYFLQRSQPPVFSQMVALYFRECLLGPEQGVFLKKFLPAMEKEYNFWMTNRRVDINHGKEKYVLNIYDPGTSEPRPESYSHDKELTGKLPEKSRLSVLRSLSAAAESGQDFSSRWLKSDHQLNSIEAEKIIPVELQAFLFRTEMLLSEFHQRLGDQKSSDKYAAAAKKREIAIQKVLWDSKGEIWRDVNLETKDFQNHNLYSSSLAPLYYGCSGMSSSPASIKKFLNKHLVDGGLLCPGGVVCSTIQSGQQWDYPNAWAPNQEELVTFLLGYNHFKEKTTKADPDLQKLALSIAQRWLNSTYCGFLKTKQLHEKYDATNLGRPGFGGEYIVQEGFGWTNGTILYFLHLFGDQLEEPSCPENSSPESEQPTKLR